MDEFLPPWAWVLNGWWKTQWMLKEHKECWTVGTNRSILWYRNIVRYNEVYFDLIEVYYDSWVFHVSVVNGPIFDPNLSKYTKKFHHSIRCITIQYDISKYTSTIEVNLDIFDRSVLRLVPTVKNQMTLSFLNLWRADQWYLPRPVLQIMFKTRQWQ